ncbi:aldose 1-epimerase [Deinococcus seoulensis]|uniref:Aldose 1-epimerase n=2 Tax=Deinococcus TaxID=1298 RepID=A0ABQ2RYK0_9DEIO|nr:MULTISPECIES: aldose epimerase family protein [Deinococcus]GGR69380.1 aldose 1-epimerase [Deinococcus seoulensis]GGS28510.1 aldose 1-epimerase [Deinococcus knuensis]
MTGHSPLPVTPPPVGTLDTRDWDGLPGALLFTLTLPDGTEARLSNLGATLVSLRVPDRSGVLADVTLGHDDPRAYLDRARTPYFGATIGRYANRIAGGRFPLDGREVQLPLVEPHTTLHGGPDGFDRRLWDAQGSVGEDGPTVLFTRLSPDGEEGFPGNLNVSVRYTLRPDRAVQIDYHAVTDAPTVVNLTHHSYWNLSGDPSCPVLDHEVRITAAQFTPVDAHLLPESAHAPVQGTPFDLREARVLADALAAPHPQTERCGGFDHNFVLNGPAGQLRLAATVRHAPSGRVMDVQTTEPGVQFYTGNALDGRVQGRGNVTYAAHAALCLEPQHYPDSPNRPDFPSTRLDPGQAWYSRTVYAFRTDD